jgi:predicted nucleic acid-binding protein
MIYFDTSAMVKLTFTEDETPALREWLAERPDVPRFSSAVIRVELPRAIMRRQPAALLSGHRLIAATKKVLVTAEVLDIAKMLQPAALGSLDTIHLASAITVQTRLTTFVTYDKKQFTAAVAMGLPAASPN